MAKTRCKKQSSLLEYQGGVASTSGGKYACLCSRAHQLRHAKVAWQCIEGLCKSWTLDWTGLWTGLWTHCKFCVSESVIDERVYELH